MTLRCSIPGCDCPNAPWRFAPPSAIVGVCTCPWTPYRGGLMHASGCPALTLPQVTQESPSVTLHPVTEEAVRVLKVEIALSELEALRAAAASAHSLAREVDEAKRVVQDSLDRLEAARHERDIARAELRRITSPAAP